VLLHHSKFGDSNLNIFAIRNNQSVHEMKNATKNLLLRSGLLRMVGRLRPCGAAILMYHSVLEDPRSEEFFLGGIGHSQAVFRGQMELLARRYHPVSLDEITQFARRKGELPRRSVAVTFDDGYADNYEVAAPILKSVGVPATFYATVDCVERRRLPWPSELRFVFRKTKKENWVDSASRTWPLRDENDRESALLRSCDECCTQAGAPQDDYVSRVAHDLDIEVPAESGKLMMDYVQMKDLLAQGHIVGSHTLTHPNVAYLEPEATRRELAESKQRLEQGLQGPVVHFSYPCPALPPSWTDQTVAASREAGYETAVTTNRGLVRKDDDPLQLNRIRPTKTVQGLWWNLECAFAGRLV
jgi:peptidoglycan/xylan/chitin deacetylase (PgdA/CDA1 family)